MIKSTPLQKLTNHQEKIERIQNQMGNNHQSIAFTHAKNYSNTARSKSYKKNCTVIDCSNLNAVLSIDDRCAIVEPGISMENLVEETLKYGLIPPVVPEFKGITVGGAIMGAAGESSSHHWGIFHDTCLNSELLLGNGQCIEISPQQNEDLFYGISGSYGSFGLLTKVKLQLIPALSSVFLNYHIFNQPEEALDYLLAQTGKIEFLDGIIFSKKLAVIMEGEQTTKSASLSLSSKWFTKHVQNIGERGKAYHEVIPLKDYLFRYDSGAFWMGSFLFLPSFLARFLWQGILKQQSDDQGFTQDLQEHYSQCRYPPEGIRALVWPLMKSQSLWKLMHLAEHWVQKRFIIQDFCLPKSHCHSFLAQFMNGCGIYPLWLCPIKKTTTPQLFAPHKNQEDLVNFGAYGIPQVNILPALILKKLEEITYQFNGRKVLYSHSSYEETEFWKIYSLKDYKKLRAKSHSEGVFKEITEKIFSK